MTSDESVKWSLNLHTSLLEIKRSHIRQLSIESSSISSGGQQPEPKRFQQNPHNACYDINANCQTLEKLRQGKKCTARVEPAPYCSTHNSRSTQPPPLLLLTAVISTILWIKSTQSSPFHPYCPVIAAAYVLTYRNQVGITFASLQCTPWKCYNMKSNSNLFLMYRPVYIYPFYPAHMHKG